MNIRMGFKALACVTLIGGTMISAEAGANGLRSPVGLLNLGHDGDIGVNLGRRHGSIGNLGGIGNRVDNIGVGGIGIDLGGRRSDGNVGVDLGNGHGIAGTGRVGGILGGNLLRR